MFHLSRRRLIQSSASLFASLFVRGWGAAYAASPNVKISLAKEFPDARLLSVSPDGTKLCLEDWGISGYQLRVVEAGTWRTMYTGAFKTRALLVDFFSDSRVLFLDFPGGKGELSHRQTVVDIQSGERMEQMRAFDPFQYFEQMSPIDDRTLLVAHYAHVPNKPHQLQWLSRVAFPSYRELIRVDLSTEGTGSKPGADVSLSADRSLAAYFYNNELICRRTVDLGVVWEHPIKSGLRAFPSISAHGNFVAAAIARSGSTGQFEKYTHLHISVYSIKTGAEVARLPISGKEGFALSPDGKLLAVVVSEPNKKGEILPTVHIFDVSSNAEIGSMVHDRIPSGRRQFLLGGCGIVFTADGKYVVTSGAVTKVWKLGD